MRVISVDAGWRQGGNRNAAVVADDEGHVLAWKPELDYAGLRGFVKEHVEDIGAVLLDIPIEGCSSLGANGFRAIDLAVSRCGMWALPASKAGQWGVTLKQEMGGLVPAARVLEIYPYAVYKFLSFQGRNGTLQRLQATELSTFPHEGFGPFVPCKYKRARSDERREALLNLKMLLEHPAFGLSFAEPLPTSGCGLSLAVLADLYDACLGAIAGILLLRHSPYARVFGDKANGEMLLLADEWLAQRVEHEFEKAKKV